MRSVAVCIAVVLGLAGCASSEKTYERVMPGTEFETSQACHELLEKTRALTHEGKPAIRVLPIKNETDQAMDMTLVADKVREALLESEKFVVLADRAGRDPAEPPYEETAGPPCPYELAGKVSNRRAQNGEKKSVRTRYHFEIVDTKSRAIVLVADTESRKESSK